MLRTVSSLALQLLIWLPIVGLSLLLAANSLPYFTFDTTYSLLTEKQDALSDPIYLPIFYLHVLSGIPCLLLPVLNFSKRVLRNKRNLHVMLGRWYSKVTLFVVAPTGMYLAWYAKGGATGKISFWALGILLATFTWLGIRAIKQKDVAGHIDWMTRSYAMATSALTFRVFHILFYALYMPYETNYQTSLVLSLIVNMGLGELAIRWFRKNNTYVKSTSPSTRLQLNSEKQ